MTNLDTEGTAISDELPLTKYVITDHTGCRLCTDDPEQAAKLFAGLSAPQTSEDKDRVSAVLARIAGESAPLPASGVTDEQVEAKEDAWSTFEDANRLVMDGHRHVKWRECRDAFDAAWMPGQTMAAVRAASAQLSALPPSRDDAVGVRVKALEWVRSHMTPWDGDYHTVPTAYTIRCADENGYKWQGFGGHGYESSPEAAQAAAFLNHKQRSLSAIEATQLPIDALLEADDLVARLRGNVGPDFPWHQVMPLLTEAADRIDTLTAALDGAIEAKQAANYEAAEAEDIAVEACTRSAAAEARIAELEAALILAPAECDPSCDDPDCPYSHRPLTLRQAYENAVTRAHQAEARIAELEAALREARMQALASDGQAQEALGRVAKLEAALKMARPMISTREHIDESGWGKGTSPATPILRVIDAALSKPAPVKG